MFIGREREIETAVERLLRPETRLITLTGTGGTGKTRLGLQVAAEVVENFSDGVFLVPLAPLTDAGLVTSTIAQTLGVMETGGTPLLESLKQFLHDKELLLLLDNFEQVLEAAPVVADLLEAARELKVLVTSRSALQLYGEHEYPVPSLSLPDPKRLPPLEKMNQYEAVRLFIERAQAVKPDFAVTNANAPAVAAICHRLDGLPLAIELAAARTRLFPPQALLTRLASRLSVLTGGARNLATRQQTLRGAIDWSYSLLEPGEQTLLARLSVFMGGRSLEAIEAICNAEGDLDVLGGVDSLLSKSLLLQEELDGEPRLMMLETVHEYASEKLEESGEAETIRRNHADYFLTLAEAAEPHLFGPEQAAWLERLETEHDNFRVALRWAEKNVEIGLRLAGSLWWFWQIRGHLSEGREWLARALAQAGTARTAARAKALRGAAPLAATQDDYTSARSLFEESLSIYQELEDKQGIAEVLNDLGITTLRQGDYTSARPLLEKSLAIFRELGNKWGIPISLASLGSIADEQGDYTLARSLYEESLVISRESGDKRIIAYALANLGYMAEKQGDYTSARSLYEESLAIFQELKSKEGIAIGLGNLGFVAYLQGDYASAWVLLKKGLTIGQEAGLKSLIAESWDDIAALVAAEGNPEQAARLWGAAEALREVIGAPLDPGNRPRYERDVEAARVQLDEERFSAAWTEGRRMSVEEAVTYALTSGPPA